MNDLTIIPPRGKKGVAVLDVATHPLIEVFKTGEWCKRVAQSGQVPRIDPGYSLVSLCDGNAPAEQRSKIIADSKTFRDLLLPYAVEVRAAADQLEEIINPDNPDNEHVVTVTPVVAGKMITTLFNARTKKKGDEAETRLAACISLFDPVDNAIGAATGLWADLPRHPAILALAIKKLIRELVFTPEPAELATACRRVRSNLLEMQRHVDDFLTRMRYVEEVLIKYDHEGWKAAYRSKAAIDAGAAIKLFSKRFPTDEQHHRYVQRLMLLDDLERELDRPRDDSEGAAEAAPEAEEPEP